jgi:hypothetical protein
VAPSQQQPRWLEHIDLPETMTLAVLLQLDRSCANSLMASRLSNATQVAVRMLQAYIKNSNVEQVGSAGEA